MSRPVLKWAGGKARLAPRIVEAFEGPCRGVWYEPFLGSGAVFLYRKARKQIGHAVLSDANPKLIAMHTAIRDDVDAVLDALHALPKDDWREAYYEQRALFNLGPWEGPLHAARLIWLNRTGFNGLYRENRSGGYNVPVGRYASLKLPADDLIRRVSTLFQDTELRACGFDDVMVHATTHDQVYCDPPYVPLNATADFTAYCKQPFGLDAQVSLAQMAQRAAWRGADVVLSNHDLPLVRHELYPQSCGFEYVSRPDVSRAISRSVNSRKPIREVIARLRARRRVA